MLHLHHIPRPPLSTLVECLWYWEGERGPYRLERLLPNGESSIIFNLRDEPIRLYDAADVRRFETYGHAVLSGARCDCFVIDTNQQERVIGIQFRAGGAFPFFRMPAWEAEGSSIALEDVWPGRGWEIRERLLEAGAPEAMFAILEEALLAQLVRAPELHPAVTYAVARFARCELGGTVGAVTERIGLSSRRFIELFHREVGLKPKTFARVRRFQKALRTVRAARRIEWAQVALESGYYDQAHFIHDFQRFSGFTPAVYATLATPHLNHVPLP